MTLDYEYYTKEYQGNILASSNFDYFKKKAEEYISARVNVLSIKSDMFDCVCAIAEELYQEKQDNNNLITSESIGSWSRSYDITNKKNRKNMILFDYLSNKGYLYTGL